MNANGGRRPPLSPRRLAFDSAGEAARACARVSAREDVPTLEGELVRLRPMVESDRAALIGVLADPTVIEWWDTRGPERSAMELIAAPRRAALRRGRVAP